MSSLIDFIRTRWIMPFKRRRIAWISSTNGDTEQLRKLSLQMGSFYSTVEGRGNYQILLDKENEMVMSKQKSPSEIVQYIVTHGEWPSSILEIGCGSGNLYQQLKESSMEIRYTGMEMADHIVESNREQFPEAKWITGSAYQIPFESDSFDFVFAHYVVEHLIYVETALHEMMRVLKSGGQLLLVFPDFVEMNVVSSQCIGLSSLPSTKDRLKRGKLLDAAISYYDSRIRIPSALSKIKTYGSFPVNINPACLAYPHHPQRPDLDAIYIASKSEIKTWATAQQHLVVVPPGQPQQTADKSFLVIQKRADMTPPKNH